MDLKKKVDQLLQELKLGKFSKVISDGEKLLKKNQDKGYNNSERLFSLLMFELWRKKFKINL